jgi:hypothetical protein
MTVGCSTAMRFETLLRQFFNTDHFTVVVRECDRLIGLVRHVLAPLGPDYRTELYFDIARFARALHGVPVQHTEDSSTVITGHFENQPCTVTIVSSSPGNSYPPSRT